MTKYKKKVWAIADVSDEAIYKVKKLAKVKKKRIGQLLDNIILNEQMDEKNINNSYSNVKLGNIEKSLELIRLELKLVKDIQIHGFETSAKLILEKRSILDKIFRQ